jgi:polyisoprenyl-phosphate glycosyltransferase
MLGDHTVSIVVPVYRGEQHLRALVTEIAEFIEPHTSADGHPYRVVEVVLVDDCGPDDSARVIRELADEHDWVRPVWLSRNFGQHPATIAGMASSSGEWIVTMDEDGQHDPADIASLLDAALREQASLVYAAPTNAAPHSHFRNMTSKAAKRILNALSGGADASNFHSFRLMLGEVGRSVAAYVGQGVYLDIALAWVAKSPATAPVTLRDEGERQSGYSTRTLLSHFWRMVLTSGTRGLRIVSLLGVAFAVLGVVLAVVFTVDRLNGGDVPAGWTSQIVVTLLSAGMVLFSLGVVAEYVGVAVNMAMGRPLYLITGDPATGPLARKPHDA